MMKECPVCGVRLSEDADYRRKYCDKHKTKRGRVEDGYCYRCVSKPSLNNVGYCKDCREYERERWRNIRSEDS